VSGGHVIGRGPTSTVWHIIRPPDDREGTEEDRADPTWRLSLCSHVWRITETAEGRPTCYHCVKRVFAGWP